MLSVFIGFTFRWDVRLLLHFFFQTYRLSQSFYSGQHVSHLQYPFGAGLFTDDAQDLFAIGL